jgi:hypothetical protein
MGKASRMKKERKANWSTHTAASGGDHSKLSSTAKKKQGGKANGNDGRSVADLFDQFKGDNLIVIDGNGVAHGEQDSRRMYWEDVNSALIERGASCLPEMAALGRLLNLSIFDVMIPVVDLATGQQTDDDIFTAVFLLDYVDCFQWLLSQAFPMGCNHALLGNVFKFIVANVPRIEIESPRMVMANMIVRFMAEWHHSEGVLDRAIADSNSVMGQPFARQIAKDYLAELAAVKELAALDALIPDLGRAGEPNPNDVEACNAVFAQPRGGCKSMRI